MPRSSTIPALILTVALALLTPLQAFASDEHKTGLAVPLEQPPDFVTIRARHLASRIDLDLVRHDEGAVYRLFDWTVGNELYRAYQDPGAVFGNNAYPFVITEVCLPMHFPHAGRITLAANISESHKSKDRRQPGDLLTTSRPREIHIPHAGAYLIYIPLDTPTTVHEPFFAGMFIQNPLSSRDSVALFLDNIPAAQTCFNYWGYPEVWIDMNDTAYCNLPGRLLLYAAGRPHGGIRPAVTIRPPRDTAIFLCTPQTLRLPVSAFNQHKQPLPVTILDGPGIISGDFWEFTATRDTAFTVTLATATASLADTADFHISIRINRPPWIDLPDDTTLLLDNNSTIAWPLPLGDTDRNLFASYLLTGPGTIADNTWHLSPKRVATAEPHLLVVRVSDFCRCSAVDTVIVTIEQQPTPIASTISNETPGLAPPDPARDRFDLDRDGTAGIIDLQLLVAFILFDSPPPAAGAEACDINADDQISAADITAFRHYLFPDRATTAR